METARDSARSDSLSQIAVALEEYAKIRARYPEPDNAAGAYYSGSLLFRQ